MTRLGQIETKLIQLNLKEITQMKYDELFPSKFLKASDFEEGETKIVTIKDVQLEEVGKKDAEVETKPVVYFREKDQKPIVCNKTNATTIRNLYGNDTDEWIGRKITLFVTQVDSFGEQVDAIRVRAKVPTVPIKSAPEPEPQREPEWLEEIDQAPEAQAAKTLNLPEDHKFDKAKSNGKRTINFGKSTMFPTLMTWAQKQGYFEVGDKTIVPRLTNVLLGAGIEKFEDGAFETYKQIVAAHYAAKAEANKA